MSDDIKRREYDLIYPSIIRNRVDPQSRHPPPHAPASTSHSEEGNEAAQIAAIRRQKEERDSLLGVKRNALGASIFELQRSIRRLEQDIKNLAGVVAAEKDAEARKSNWGTWLASSLYNQVQENEEDKARKDRGRQERMIEKDLKERRLRMQQAELLLKENQMRQAKMEVDAANLRSDQAIQALEAKKRDREAQKQRERERMNEEERRSKIRKQQEEELERQAREEEERERWEKERWASFLKQHQERREREAREQQEKEKAEEERQKQLRKQQQEQREKEAQEAREYLRKLETEARAAERAHQEESIRFRQRWGNNLSSNVDSSGNRRSHTSVCDHAGWWEKVQGRAACPSCSEVWTYLLQCPDCQTKACPKCQRDLKPRPGKARRNYTRPRSPRPYGYGYDD